MRLQSHQLVTKNTDLKTRVLMECKTGDRRSQAKGTLRKSWFDRVRENMNNLAYHKRMQKLAEKDSKWVTTWSSPEN